MSAEENKALIRTYLDVVWNKADAAAAPLFLGSQCTAHLVHHNPWVVPPGPDHIASVVREFQAGFPDMRDEIEDMVAEGEKVAVWSAFTGTHTGEFVGIPPTRRKVRFTGLRIFRIAEGKIAEYWALWDWLGLYQQLGVLPETGEILPKPRAEP